MANTICEVEGCEKPPRSAHAVLCGMHYHRWYRHGDVNRVASTAGVSASNGRRYRSRYLPGHPLAKSNGKVYAHRAVLYDAIGAGPHTCHWCGRPVRWEATRGDVDCLSVDHLNAVGDDNRPENLVPACSGCNSARGSQARSQALRDAGWWSQNDTVAQLRSGGRRELIGAGCERAQVV